jgi:hypothetical protein
MSRSRRRSVSFRQRDVLRPPQEQPWVWKSLEMHMSPAFRKMSVACREFIQYLEVQNMHSAGHDNGRLKATHRQLIEWGINAGRVTAAINEAVERGLVEKIVGGYRGHGRNWPTMFRLTYYGTKRTTVSGAWEWVEPSDDWKRYRSRKNNLNALESKGAMPYEAQA